MQTQIDVLDRREGSVWRRLRGAAGVPRRTSAEADEARAMLKITLAPIL